MGPEGGCRVPLELGIEVFEAEGFVEPFAELLGRARALLQPSPNESGRGGIRILHWLYGAHYSGSPFAQRHCILWGLGSCRRECFQWCEGRESRPSLSKGKVSVNLSFRILFSCGHFGQLLEYAWCDPWQFTLESLFVQPTAWSYVPQNLAQYSVPLHEVDDCLFRQQVKHFRGFLTYRLTSPVR